MGVGVKCQGKYGSGCKVPWGMEGNARGTYWSGSKVPGECRGMSGKRTVVGSKCQGNARECSVGANSPRMQGNAQEYQANVNGWVQCAREI